VEQFINSIPKPFLVTVICAVSVFVILMANPQYTECHAQIEIFKKNLLADIFMQQGQRRAFSPRLASQISNCKQGNGPGGCFELFQTSRKVLRELRNFPETCNADLAGMGEVRRAIESPMALMVQVAWGDEPPEGPEHRFRWFESADIALFCQLREVYERLYGAEAYLAFRTAVGAGLPGESATFEKGICTNCEFRKSAGAVLSPDEIWKRSLFSTPCGRIQY